MKFARSGLTKIYLFIIALLLCCISVGSAAFIHVQNYENNTITGGSPTYVVVAKKTSDNGKNWTDYHSVEEAINNSTSGDIIAIVPNSNASINKNITLPANVTLTLPIDGTNLSTTPANGNNDEAFYEGEEGIPRDRLDYTIVNTLTIKKNVVFTVNGILDIYGQLSAAGGGAYYIGHPFGNISAVLMDEGSCISLNGSDAKIYAKGLIKDNRTSTSQLQPKVIMSDNSYCKTPFILRDFRGGSVTAAIYKETFDFEVNLGFTKYTSTPLHGISKKMAPFYQTEILNIEPILELDSNCILEGVINISANGSIQNQVSKVIGNTTDCFLQLNDGSKVIADYDPTTEVCDLNIIGGAKLNGLSVKVNALFKVLECNTASFVYPLTWRYNVTLSKLPSQESANFIIPQDFKCMPGSKLIVEEGANLDVDGSFVVMKHRNDPNDKTSFSDFKETYNKETEDQIACKYCKPEYPLSMTDAQFINNGHAEFKTFGGLMTTTKANSSFLISDNNSVTTYEPLTYNVNYDTLNKYKSNIVTYDTLKTPALAKVGGTLVTPSTGLNYVSDEACDWNLDLGEEITKQIVLSTPDKVTIPSDATENQTATIGGTVIGFTYEEAQALEVSITKNNASTTEVTKTSYEVNSQGSSQTGYPITIKLSINYSIAAGDHSYSVKLGESNGVSHTITLSVTKNKSEGGGSSGGCLIEGTLIRLANGETKAVEDIVSGEELMVFNHETGKLDKASVLFNDIEDYNNYNVVYLQFESGKEIGVISEHGFFDLNTMKYEYVDEFNYKQFIGHNFANIDKYGNLIEDRLVNAFVRNEYRKAYSPVTKYHMNYFTENILTMPGGIKGLFNIFEMREDLSYDPIKKANDIEKYGLFTYDDFKQYVSLEIFESFPTPYFKVSIGKGLLTWDELFYYIERYAPLVND